MFGALINLTVRVDAYFHQVRLTYLIQPGPFFRTALNWGKPAKHFLFLRTLQKGQTSYCPLFNSSSISTMRKALKFMDPLASILSDQGFLDEYELDEFNPPHTVTTLSLLQLWPCRLRRKIPLRQPATSSRGNIFWRHSRFYPQTNRTTH